MDLEHIRYSGYGNSNFQSHYHNLSQTAKRISLHVAEDIDDNTPKPKLVIVCSLWIGSDSNDLNEIDFQVNARAHYDLEMLNYSIKQTTIVPTEPLKKLLEASMKHYNDEIQSLSKNAPVLSHYLLTEQEQDIARNQLPNEYRLDSKGIELFG